MISQLNGLIDRFCKYIQNLPNVCFLCAFFTDVFLVSMSFLELLRVKIKNSQRFMSSLKDDQNCYQVETILQRKYENEQFKYLVKWSGWSEDANSWEPLQNLLGCPYIQEMVRKIDFIEDTKSKNWGQNKEISQNQLKKKILDDIQVKTKVTQYPKDQEYPFFEKVKPKKIGNIKILRIQRGPQNQYYCALANGLKIPIEWARLLADEELLKVYESMSHSCKSRI